MKKIKLHGIGNRNKYNYYIFDKKNEAVSILSKTIYETTKLVWNLYIEKEDKKGNWVDRKINFDKRKEGHEGISGTNKERMDIFYGNKKIFLTLYCSLTIRKKFNKALEKISYMPKPEKC